MAKLVSSRVKPSASEPKHVDMEQQEDQQLISSLNFEYNDKTFRSYAAKGLTVPDHVDYQEIKFLADMNEDTIKQVERRITRVVRIMAPDLLSGNKKRVFKDYMFYFENWYGVDWKGEDIAPVTDHIEGMYYEQDVKPEPFVRGKPTGKFRRTGQHEVYYLEYSKEKLDEILENNNSADRDEIMYVIEVPGMRIGPNGGFGYEAFSTKSFQELLKIGKSNNPQ